MKRWIFYNSIPLLLYVSLMYAQSISNTQVFNPSSGGGSPSLRVCKYTSEKTAGSWTQTASVGCAAVIAPQAAEEDTAQTINIFTLPARSMVGPAVVKSTTACTGATTIIVTDIGVGSNGSFLLNSAAYDLKEAPGDTNFTSGVDEATDLRVQSYAAVIVNVTVETSVENVDDIADGCAFEIGVVYAVIP